MAAAALLLSACGYSDTALTPPDRGPALKAVLAPETGKRGEYGLGAPFVVIRFGPLPVDYQEALAGAVAEAVAKRPSVKFHVLAVTAGGGPHLPREASLRHAEAVLHSLADMGVPQGQVFLAAAAAPPTALIDEVRLYLR